MPEPVRIKDIPENELTLEQAKVFKDLVAGRGRLLTTYRIWIHSPRLAAALETIGTFLNKKGSLRYGASSSRPTSRRWSFFSLHRTRAPLPVRRLPWMGGEPVDRLLEERFPDWDPLHLESRIHREAFFNGLQFRGSKGGMAPNAAYISGK
jgi:hypothetical protein